MKKNKIIKDTTVLVTMVAVVATLFSMFTQVLRAEGQGVRVGFDACAPVPMTVPVTEG